jgi:hypothetical protein
MVALTTRRAAAAYCFTFVATVLGGCTADVLVPHTNEPMVYLVLTPDSLTGLQMELRAVLATTATPVRVEYRSADSFIMRRASDGALFDWREDATASAVYTPFGGNFVLAESASTLGLGRDALTPGETYTLTISSLGRTITGRATIPARPQPVVIEGPDRRVVEWPRAAAAAMYLVETDSELRELQHVIVDTFFVLPDDRPETPGVPQRFRITAVDSNWFRFMRDTSTVSAGLEGAYGLFGATSRTVIDLPPRR